MRSVCCVFSFGPPALFCLLSCFYHPVSPGASLQLADVRSQSTRLVLAVNPESHTRTHTHMQQCMHTLSLSSHTHPLQLWLVVCVVFVALSRVATNDSIVLREAGKLGAQTLSSSSVRPVHCSIQLNGLFQQELLKEREKRNDWRRGGRESKRRSCRRELNKRRGGRWEERELKKGERVEI